MVQHLNRLLRLVPRSVVVFALKIVGAGLAFLTNVIVARLASKDIAGVYFGLLSVTTLLFAVARYGLGYSTAKLVAAADARGEIDLIGATMFESLKAVGTYSIIVMGLALATSIILIETSWISWPAAASALMLCSIAPFCVGSIIMEGVRGMRRSFAFGLFDSVIFKSVILAGLASFGFTFGITGLAIGYLLATIANAFLAYWVFRSGYSSGIGKRFTNAEQADYLRSITHPLAIVSISTIAVQWAPTIFVSLILNPSVAAEYFAAFRTAAVLDFIVIAASVVVGPELVRASQLHGDRLMVRAAVKAATSVFISATVIASMLFLFAPDVMQLYGRVYADGGGVLRILVVGQVFAAPFAFGLQVLIAGGHERKAAKTAALTAITGVTVIFLSSHYGGNIGAAIGQSTALVVQALSLSFTAWRASKAKATDQSQQTSSYR